MVRPTALHGHGREFGNRCALCARSVFVSEYWFLRFGTGPPSTGYWQVRVWSARSGCADKLSKHIQKDDGYYKAGLEVMGLQGTMYPRLEADLGRRVGSKWLGVGWYERQVHRGGEVVLP